jgi:hypothetical protein
MLAPNRNGRPGLVVVSCLDGTRLVLFFPYAANIMNLREWRRRKTDKEIR